jgi:ribosomal protein S3
MESGAKGCEVHHVLTIVCLVSTYADVAHVLIRPFWVCQVIVSGKLRAQRAKSMKFKDGYMISSGHPVNQYIDGAVRHVLLRQVGVRYFT